MHFDRFDICAAYNLYAIHYGWDRYTHGIIARLVALQYEPGRTDQYYDSLSENAQEIYDALVARRGHVSATEYVVQAMLHDVVQFEEFLPTKEAALLRAARYARDIALECTSVRVITSDGEFVAECTG